MDKNIKFILDILPYNLYGYFEKYTVTEIRLRRGFPIKIFTETGCIKTDDTKVDEKNLKDIFMSLCQYTISVYRSQIENGFITLPGGHRIGIGGKYDYDSGRIIISNISSLNIRLASEVNYCYNQKLLDFKHGLLIAGPPHSGKTTLLKTICRTTAENIVICDERNEFLSENFDCDRISGIPKTTAISQAVRSMNPDIIICDEIGSYEEARRLLSFTNAGVKFISSVHAESVERLLYKPNIKILLDNMVFDKIAVLGKKQSEYFIREIVDV